jgi:hypothetical protein
MVRPLATLSRAGSISRLRSALAVVHSNSKGSGPSGFVTGIDRSISNQADRFRWLDALTINPFLVCKEVTTKQIQMRLHCQCLHQGTSSCRRNVNLPMNRR